MSVSNATPLVIVGRWPSFPERQYWQRLHDALRRTAVLLMVILTVIFAHSALVNACFAPFWEALLSFVVLGPATCLVIWYLFHDYHARGNALKTQWYTEQADKARLAGGYTVTFYDDRVVVTDLRGENTMLFERVTLCTETVHGFCLQAGTAEVLIRAADLTPDLVEEVRARLQTAVPRERYRQKSRAFGCLREVLPLPVFENDDVVLTHAVVRARRNLSKERRTMARMFALPAGVIYGGTVAQMVSITPSYLLDLPLLAVAGALICAGILTVLAAPITPRTTVQLALTRDGVAALANDRLYFYTWERVQRRQTPTQLILAFPDGARLLVPFSAMNHPEAIRY